MDESDDEEYGATEMQSDQTGEKIQPFNLPERRGAD